MPRFLLRRPPLLLRFLSSASSAKTDLVVSTLRRHGIPAKLSSSVVARFPRILALRPDKNLDPKLAFFHSQGFSGPEVAKILLCNPYVLLRSLVWFLAPSVALLKSSYAKDDVLYHIMCNRWVYSCPNLDNVNLLRDRGVPELAIVRLINSRPDPTECTQRDFHRSLEFIEKLNIWPTAAAFSTALCTLHRMSRFAIQGKIKLYKKLGWSEEEVLGMFRLDPATMGLSEGVVRERVGYLRDALGWGPEVVCRHPEILKMSVEGRIAPRLAVLDSLMSRGLIRRMLDPVRKLKLSEESFLEEFVEKHEEAAPDVARAYYYAEEEADFSGCSWLKEDAENHI